MLVSGRTFLVFQKALIAILFVKYPSLYKSCVIYIVVVCWYLKKIE